MYPPEAVTLMTGLIRGGLLDLAHFDVTSFALDDANDAAAHAVANSGPFRLTAIRP